MKDQVDKIVVQWEEERPDLDPSPLAILARVVRLSKHIANSLRQTLAPFGLDTWSFDVLGALRRQGRPFAMTPTELRRATILTSGAMTNRIDRLEARGLVERIADPSDRRGIKVRLTAKGLTLVDEAVVARLQSAEQLVSHLDSHERDQLAGLLRKLLLTTPLEVVH